MKKLSEKGLWFFVEKTIKWVSSYKRDFLKDFSKIILPEGFRDTPDVDVRVHTEHAHFAQIVI